jgi:hypothetical protein
VQEKDQDQERGKVPDEESAREKDLPKELLMANRFASHSIPQRDAPVLALMIVCMFAATGAVTGRTPCWSAPGPVVLEARQRQRRLV